MIRTCSESPVISITTVFGMLILMRPFYIGWKGCGELRARVNLKN
jgi:hypothetical protein